MPTYARFDSARLGRARRQRVHDKMVPSSNSVDLARRLPHAELVLYEDAGHGGVFQYHEAFVKKALEFLEA